MSKIEIEFPNNVDHDMVADKEPPHLNLCCLAWIKQFLKCCRRKFYHLLLGTVIWFSQIVGSAGFKRKKIPRSIRNSDYYLYLLIKFITWMMILVHSDMYFITTQFSLTYN